MVVKWFAKAQLHWDEQLMYCAETFGRNTALESIQTVEEKIERICKYPESGTPEPLLKDEKHLYRFVHIRQYTKSQEFLDKHKKAA